jgi:uncharacterized glyoxalase superfamily protein PhnB
VDDEQTVSSAVEVAIDPATAFKAFTEEMDLWWLRGPINFFGDGGRVVEVRCEAGLGGRIGEVVDDRVHGELREKARITAWEPGERLAWSSSIDDVTTEVRFTPVAGGTRVVVEHRIPAGGEDRGGTAWNRVVPSWYGRWCAKRDHVPHEQIDIARLGLALHYARPGAAAHWLADVFGFEPVDELPSEPDPLPRGDHGPPWIEFHIGNASVMLFELEGGPVTGGPAHVPWVYVDDFDTHLARAEAKGATIVRRNEWDFLPTYVAEDLEGNHWTFTQARPTQR